VCEGQCRRLGCVNVIVVWAPHLDLDLDLIELGESLTCRIRFDIRFRALKTSAMQEKKVQYIVLCFKLWPERGRKRKSRRSACYL
jgi:hypothetical protein